MRGPSHTLCPAWLLLFVSSLVLLACGGANEDALLRRGRAVFETNCIACHARDPAQDGALGPAVAGSSLALLESKVLRNTYPAGYTPKRDTRTMIPFPHLEGDIEALAIYLASAAPPPPVSP